MFIVDSTIARDATAISKSAGALLAGFAENSIAKRAGQSLSRQKYSATAVFTTFQDRASFAHANCSTLTTRPVERRVMIYDARCVC